jgi:hypothetical protein
MGSYIRRRYYRVPAEFGNWTPVCCVVSPNKLHHLFLPEWRNRWPDARLRAPPGLARRKKQLRFDAELGDEPDCQWSADIAQVVFRGSFFMEEVVFFHRASRTAIFGDFIFPKKWLTAGKGSSCASMVLWGDTGARHAIGVSASSHGRRHGQRDERCWHGSLNGC